MAGFLQNISRLFQGHIFLLVSILFLSSCGNSDAALNEYNSKSLGIEEIKNADINYTLGGKAKAKLLSPLMLRVQETNPYVEFPKTLHVDFYNETGQVDSRKIWPWNKRDIFCKKPAMKKVVLINKTKNTLIVFRFLKPGGIH